MEDCVFCKLINGKITVDPVYQDDDVFVIKDIAPKAPVHLLIMPKVHISNLDGVSDENSSLLSKIMFTAKKVANQMGISGKYKVTTNIGEMAGQTVFHMHFHLLGGWEKKDDVVSELKQ